MLLQLYVHFKGYVVGTGLATSSFQLDASEHSTIGILFSKLLRSVSCFAELVETGIWAVWAEQN